MGTVPYLDDLFSSDSKLSTQESFDDLQVVICMFRFRSIF